MKAHGAINHTVSRPRRRFIRSSSVVTFSFGFNYRRLVRPGRARAGPHRLPVRWADSNRRPIPRPIADVRALPCRILRRVCKPAKFYDGACVRSVERRASVCVGCCLVLDTASTNYPITLQRVVLVLANCLTLVCN